MQSEVLGKSHDPRFGRRPIEATWKKMTTAGRIEILSDDITNEQFSDATTRISGMPAKNRLRVKGSLGEIMVIAHASVLVQSGRRVFVLIDESDGRNRAETEIRWLVDNKFPRFGLWSTPQVLRHAGEQGWLDEPWETVYGELSRFDDGLPPLSVIANRK